MLKERKIHIIILAFLMGLFIGVNLSVSISADEPAHKYLDYFHKVYQLIRTEYVDKSDTKKIFYGAIRGMIKSLSDPFSRFLDEQAYTELQEETKGEYVGIGIEITVKDGQIVIISPIEGTPAMKAGIESGDVIVKINDISIKKKSLTDVIKLIRGLPNSKIKLAITRNGMEEPLDFELERVPVKVKSVAYSIIEGGKIGYIKIKIFSSDTRQEVEKALKFFIDKGIKKIVIDLRWNPGGLLDEAIKISDLFLKTGDLIVSTRGREGSGNVREFKAVKPQLYEGDLLVLVNKGSASASEIFSGAVRDNKRGKLLGTKTFGKGSVQKHFNLDDNIGVMLTIARYYTPSGESIHGKGIVPDIVVPFEIFTDAEKKNLILIQKNNLVHDFVQKNREYNDQTKKNFYIFLKEKKVPLSEKSADYILKSEIQHYSKRPLYDLEFDTQLAAAIKIFNK